MYLYVILRYCLLLMITRRYRKMYWKDWERIDKDIEVVPKRQNNLFVWTILLTKEAGRLASVALSIFAPVLTKRAGLNCARAEPTSRVCTPTNSSKRLQRLSIGSAGYEKNQLALSLCLYSAFDVQESQLYEADLYNDCWH